MTRNDTNRKNILMFVRFHFTKGLHSNKNSYRRWSLLYFSLNTLNVCKPLDCCKLFTLTIYDLWLLCLHVGNSALTFEKFTAANVSVFYLVPVSVASESSTRTPLCVLFEEVTSRSINDKFILTLLFFTRCFYNLEVISEHVPLHNAKIKRGTTPNLGLSRGWDPNIPSVCLASWFTYSKHTEHPWLGNATEVLRTPRASSVSF